MCLFLNVLPEFIQCTADSDPYHSFRCFFFLFRCRRHRIRGQYLVSALSPMQYTKSWTALIVVKCRTVPIEIRTNRSPPESESKAFVSGRYETRRVSSKVAIGEEKLGASQATLLALRSFAAGLLCLLSHVSSSRCNRRPWINHSDTRATRNEQVNRSAFTSVM